MEQAPQQEQKEQMPSPRSGLQEQIVYFEKHPEDIGPTYLNNLRLWLPGSTYLEQIRSLSRSWDKVRDDKEGRHTPLWQKQSMKEYTETIEQTLEELPEAQQNLQQLAAQERELQTELDDISRQFDTERDSTKRAELMNRLTVLRHRQDQLPAKINEAIIPLYLALRAKGYSHYDIVS